MGSARLQSLALAVAVAGLLALVAAGIHRSVAVDGHLPLRPGYGDWVDERIGREEWPVVQRAFELSAELDLGEPRVESVVIPNLIRLSRRLGDREGELFGWRKLVERRPSDPNARQRLVDALLAAPEVGESERREAAAQARFALHLDPGSARARWNLGRVALLDGGRDQAFAHWREAARLDRALVERWLAELRARDPEVVEAYQAGAGDRT